MFEYTWCCEELFKIHFFFSLSIGWWRSYHGIPPDISIKEHQWCLGLHQWHVQASIAQLQLSWCPQGTCAFSFSSLYWYIHTHGTFQISYTNLQHRSEWVSEQDPWPALLPSLRCVTRWVSCAWCLEVRLSCIWQEKCVLYQHALERIRNAKGCVFMYWQVALVTQRNERKEQQPGQPRYWFVQMSQCYIIQ